ncbi:MAG: DUF2442 domain-containing protein [Prevotellaceae bacterium]|jgi:hypothetical protein|nr:DUF2442 domain-containing protein [Prevotellaceae bacterium]
MYLGIKAVSPLDNYMLHLTFENGEQRRFDMKPYLNHGVFRALKQPDMFKTVKVYRDTIAWDNEIDLDPEILYPNSSRQ